jgi:hypothetical protein
VIPLWLLTILHYASLTAAVLILLLMARQAVTSRNKKSLDTHHSESRH